MDICWGVPIAVDILGCPQRVYAGVCLSPWIFDGVHSGYMLGCAYRRGYFRVSAVGICWGVPIAVDILGGSHCGGYLVVSPMCVHFVVFPTAPSLLT